MGSNVVKAVYSGDSNYATSNGTLTQIVGKKAPTLKLSLSAHSVTVGGSAYASATLGKATSTAGGTVTYTVYSDSGCSSNPSSAGTVNVSDGGVPNSNSVTFASQAPSIGKRRTQATRPTRLRRATASSLTSTKPRRRSN